jgi:hypothetical protein
MGLLLVLFWCAAVVRTVLRHDSRFGVFNSRLGPNEFPFSRQRELAGKGLIWLPFSEPNRPFSGKIEEIPGSTGITGNFAPGPNGWSRNLQGRRSALPDADLLTPTDRRVQPFAGAAVPHTPNRAGAR